MKKFSNFILEAKQYSSNIVDEDISVKLSSEEIREQYFFGNIFKEGSIVQKIDTGEIGEITRRGTNYLICVTESGQMFRAWITDVIEYECYK